MSKEIRIKMDIEGNAVEALKEIQKGYDDVKKSAENAKKVSDGLGSSPNRPSTDGPSQNLNPTGKYYKQQQRKDREEMIALAMAGDTASESFLNLQEKTGNVKDNLDEVNARVKYFSQSGAEQAATALAEGVGVIGSTAQIAIGGMELLGISTEEATATVAKLASVEAVMNGVKQISIALQSDSMFMLGLENAKMKALAFTTSAYSAVVGTSTGALKAFKLALAGTGIGLAVIAVGALASAWMDASDASDKLAASQKRVSDEAEKAAGQRKKESDEAVLGIDNQIKAQQKLRVQILRNQGKDKEANDLEQSFEAKDRDKLAKKQAIETQEVRRLEKQLKHNQDMIATYLNYSKKLNKEGDSDQAENFKKDADNLKKKNNLVQKELNENMNKLNYTNRQIETANLESINKSTSKNLVTKSTVSKQKLETVQASAPKNFTLNIQELGRIDQVNIMSDEDEKAFQQRLVNAVMSAMTTAQARVAR